jgi:hypothetical protein
MTCNGIIGKLEGNTCNYELGYNILMEYWDSLPDEEKPKIHARLEKLKI